MTSVSIIIPAWNETRVLKSTIEALADIDYDKKKCEVIVVAGGDDTTYEIARELSVNMEIFSKYVVILQGPQGKNAAIQQGIKQATNDIIVLLDADTIVSEQWLKSMVGPIDEGSCDITIANPEPVKRNWISDYYMITKAYLLNSLTTYSGHSMAFKASIVENRLEYFFDRNIKVGVDYLLVKRFVEEGRKSMFAKHASVITHLPSSLKYFVLWELQWVRAFTDINGVSYRSIACNTTVILALILAIPICKIGFILSLLFNAMYISKKVYVFLVGSRHYDTNIRNIFGFIMLSYADHVVSFISYMQFFLGLPEETYLRQGQRY